MDIRLVCFTAIFVATVDYGWAVKSEDTLELVHVVFRHGDRTPDRHVLYPKDPHANYSYHPVGFGQLTNAGKRKEYLLGKALHKRYGDFLGNYNIETVDARCTDYNRTKMSLQLVLASLFPPEDELVWEKRLKWQPVPFNYWPLKEDHVLGDPYKNCPFYKKLYFEYANSPEAKKLYEKYINLIPNVVNHTGIKRTPKKLAELYFTFSTETENQLQLPDWAKPLFPHIVTDFATIEYRIATGNDHLKRLSTGFFIKKMIDDTRLKIKQKPNTKMFLYSAHEFNLAYLMRYLNVFYPHVPPYGSCLLIEIHNINGVRGIKIFYQDYSHTKPKRLKLPNCGSFCRFEKFVNLYKNLLPNNDKECFVE